MAVPDRFYCISSYALCRLWQKYKANVKTMDEAHHCLLLLILKSFGLISIRSNEVCHENELNDADRIKKIVNEKVYLAGAEIRNSLGRPSDSKSISLVPLKT